MQSTNDINVKHHKRIEWIDVAKGYGILLVILGHLGAGRWDRFIYSFHMPLFFFLSGYIFSANKSFKEFLVTKLKTIVVPYFCLGGMLIIFQMIFEKLTGVREFSFTTLSHTVGDLIVQIRCWDLWYLTTLFLVNIVFFIFVKTFKKMWIIGLASIVMPIIGFAYYRLGGRGLVWNFDVVFFAIFFFFIGYFAKNCWHDNLTALLHKNRITFISTFLIAITMTYILSELSYAKSSVGFDMYMGTYGTPYLSFIAALLGILSIILFSKIFPIKFIRYIGKDSILYFAWHQSMIMPITEYILRKFGYKPIPDTSQFASLGCRIFQFIFIIITLTIINELILNSKLKFMLGK